MLYRQEEARRADMGLQSKMDTLGEQMSGINLGKHHEASFDASPVLSENPHLNMMVSTTLLPNWDSSVGTVGESGHGVELPSEVPPPHPHY